MTRYRIEIDAIVITKANTPEEALKLAENYVAGLEHGPDEARVQITGADSIPTVLTLTDEDDIESIDGELTSSEVGDLEAGREPDTTREAREVLEYQKRDLEGRTTDSLEENCEDCGNAAYTVVNNRPLCDLHAQAELPV